jgi:hypothetical protein
MFADDCITPSIAADRWRALLLGTVWPNSSPHYVEIIHRQAALDLRRKARIAAGTTPLTELECFAILYGSLQAARAKLVWLHARFCSLCDRYVAGADVLLPSVAMGRNLITLRPLARQLDEACRQPAEPAAVLLIIFLTIADDRARIRRDRGYVGQAGPPPGDPDHHARSAEPRCWKHRGVGSNRKFGTRKELPEFNSRSKFFPLEFFRGGKLRPERGLR